MNVTRYKWTIEIEVCAAGVADGFDASECVKRNDGGPSALCDMGEAAKWFRFDEATVKVIAAPDPKDIRPEQGYDYLRRPAEDPDAVWQVAPFDGCETCNGDGWIARLPCHDSDHHPQYPDWNESKHSTTGAMDKIPANNNTYCASCHSPFQADPDATQTHNEGIAPGEGTVGDNSMSTSQSSGS